MAAICSICLCTFKASGCGTVFLNCGHIYHKSCINQWLYRNETRSVHRKECPSCRTVVEKPRALKEVFLHFDSGEATFIEDISQGSPGLNRAEGSSLSSEELETVEALQCQLESCQIALTESINVQNNLESENSQLKQDINAQKVCMNGQKAELHRFMLINEELRNRIRKSNEEVRRIKSSKTLLEVSGHEFQQKLCSYTESVTPEVALKTLTTVLINMEKSLEKERKALKTEAKVLSASNLKVAQLSKKILDLEKEKETRTASDLNETDYSDILTRCPVVAVERSKPPVEVSKTYMMKSRNVTKFENLNSHVVDLTSEDEEEGSSSSSGADSSCNSSSIASRLNRRRTLPESPEIGNPMRKILRPRQDDGELRIRPSKMVFRVSKRNSIKLKPAVRPSTMIKK